MLNIHSLPPLSGNKATSALVMLHGLGADGRDLLNLGMVWGQELPDTEFIAPDAPDACDMAPKGYQWFSLQDRKPAAILKGVQEASPVLDEFFDKVLAETELPPSRIVVLGFSQGTMMALYTVPRRMEKMAGILGYSGALVGGESLLMGPFTRPPICLIHGQKDEVVPYAAMPYAAQLLKAAGFPVKVRAIPGLGHGIDEVGLKTGLEFIQSLLAEPSTEAAPTVQ